VNIILTYFSSCLGNFTSTSLMVQEQSYECEHIQIPVLSNPLK